MIDRPTRLAPDTPLHRVPFCVLDIETTGTSVEHDVTEIGAVRVIGGEVDGELDVQVATRFDGEIAAGLPHLLEFVRGCVVVGHNVRFDLRFIDGELVRHGYPALACPVVDTLRLARRLVADEVDDCRLGTLAAHFAFERRPTHRALDDARATVELLHLLIERASGYGVVALDDLAALPRTAGHPQAAKLAFVRDVPRAAGTITVHGAGDDVLHREHAINLHRRCLAWFASRDRRRIGPMLRAAQRFTWELDPT